jgi:hypothetical protein
MAILASQGLIRAIHQRLTTFAANARKNLQHLLCAANGSPSLSWKLFFDSLSYRKQVHIY